MAGFLLTAVDQQLPPERKPLLPVNSMAGLRTGREAA
jgi:hypothetical protein